MAGDELIINNVAITVPKDAKGTEGRPLPLDDNGEQIGMVLRQAWEHYAKHMIKDGRPLCDRDDQDIDGDKDKKERLTVSEGVSYALLRAVWMNDEARFYQTWAWARDHMQRKKLRQVYHFGKKQWIPVPSNKQDHLFAWRYLHDFGGEEGGIMHQDLYGAADADQDIAAALLFAYAKWKKEEYLQAAQAIIADIRQKYVREVGGKHYLFGGDQFVKTQEINPSYLRPFYYKELFAKFDEEKHRALWKELYDTSLEIIEQSADARLGGRKGSANLVPNWIKIDPGPKGVGIKIVESSTFKKGQGPGRGAQEFGADAARALSFGLAMAFGWGRDSTALKFLTDSTCTPSDAGPFCFFKNELAKKGTLAAFYNHDGTPYEGKTTQQDQIVMLGNLLPYYYYSGDMQTAQKIAEKLMSYYNQHGFWGRHDYYAQNWAWFGLALIYRRPNTKYTLPTLPEIEGVYPQLPLPKEFEREPEFPTDLLYHNQEAVARLYNLISRQQWREFIRVIEQVGKKGGPAATTLYFLEKYDKARLGLFENLSIIWLLQREIGKADPNVMKEALDYKKSLEKNRPDNYLVQNKLFRRRIENALILASEPLANQELLKEHGFAVEREDGESEKTWAFRIFQQIYEEYKTPKKRLNLDTNTTVIFPPYSKLLGQILLQLAVHAPDKNQALSYAADAKKVFDDIITKGKGLPGKGNPLYDEIVRQGIYKDFRKSEFYFVIAQAKMGKAQMLLLETTYLREEAEILKKVKEAYQLLTEAAKDLPGLHFLQLKQLAAECLIRQAFILKDQGKEYQSLFDAARALIYDVLNWEAEYNETVVEEEADRPLWLKQISTYSKLWLAKLIMVEAGENQSQPHQQSVTNQLDQLKEAESILTELLERKVLNEEAVADIKRTLAENLARQGFIAMDLGREEEEYQTLFTKAEKLLEEITAKDSPANKTVRAEARLWQAKILLTRTGKEINEEQKKKLLREAEEKIKEALAQDKEGKPLLKGAVLSSAYQTYGDILGALKKFDQAIKQYQLALKEHERNFDARASLADVYNWMGKYQQAEAPYQQVLGGAPADSIAAVTARLGLLEVSLRKTKGDYQQIEEKNNLNFLGQIFKNEPPGSSLHVRAIKLLLEAFSNKKAWQERIIHIANIILGTELKTKKDYPELADLLRPVSREALDPSFKAELYLELCRALIWEKRFDEAEKLLKDPKKFYADIIEKSTLLTARFELVRATLIVRKNAEEKSRKHVPQVFAAAQKVFENAADEPYLLQEAILLMIEELAGEKKFEEIIKLVDYFLSGAPTGVQSLHEVLSLKDTSLPLTKDALEKSFNERGLEHKFNDLVFELKIAKVDALIWDKQYKAALEVLEEISQLFPKQPTKSIRLWQRQGDIYRYGTGVKNLEKAEKYYRQILALEETLPQTDKVIETIAHAYLGLAKINQENHERNEAVANVKKALSPTFAEFISDDTRREAKRLLATLVDPLASISSSAYSASSQDGKWLEFQENLTLNLLKLLSLSNDWLTLTLRNQTDHNQDAVRNTPYLGLKLNPADWLTLELEHRLYFPDGLTGKGDFKYFRKPDIIASVGLWSRYAEALYSGSFNYQESLLNIHYSNAFLRPLKVLNDQVQWPWLRYAEMLGIGIEASQYHFALASRTTLPERWSLTVPSLKYSLDLAEIFSDLGYDRLKLNLFGGAVLNLIPDPQERKELHLARYWGGRWGGGLTWNAGPVTLDLNSEWQQDRFFHQWLVNFRLNLAPLF